MKRIAAAFGILLLIAFAGWTRLEPSNTREWIPAQARSPGIERDGDRVVIRNVRNFAWPDSGPPTPVWDDRSYDLDALTSVWYVVAPFETDWRGPAHAFLSFEFGDGRFLSVSVEARRELGEEYSMVSGLLRRYELIYIFGDERDLIRSRVTRQKDEVFLYPVRASRERVRELFLDVVERAHSLETRPEFYGTLRNNCTTAILDHVNAIADAPLRWGLRILLPGYSDALALERGLLDVEGSIDSARVRHRINDDVRRFADLPDFSSRIREGRTPVPRAH